MRYSLLTWSVLLALATLAIGNELKQGNNGRLRYTCPQVKPLEICDGTNFGFQVLDGCNVCTCGRKPGKVVCSIKSCSREDELTGTDKKKAAKFCAKVAKRVQKRLRDFRMAKNQKASTRDQQMWPIKCFKERKLCRDRPGVAFFDGCNRCRCPEQPASPARCDAANTCPDFLGTRKEFKRHCRTLGARIESTAGDGGRKRGRGGRRPEEQLALMMNAKRR